jgi:hypothetical protein
VSARERVAARAAAHPVGTSRLVICLASSGGRLTLLPWCVRAGNKIGDAGGSALAEALKVNATLQGLGLEGAPLAAPCGAFVCAGA